MSDCLYTFSLYLLDIDAKDHRVTVHREQNYTRTTFQGSLDGLILDDLRNPPAIRARYNLHSAKIGLSNVEPLSAYLGGSSSSNHQVIHLWTQESNHSIKISVTLSDVSIETFYGPKKESHLKFVNKTEESESHYIGHGYINILQQSLALYARYSLPTAHIFSSHFSETPEGLQQLIEHINEPANIDDCLFAARAITQAVNCDIRWKFVDARLISISLEWDGGVMIIDHNMLDGSEFINGEMSMAHATHVSRILKYILDIAYTTGEHSGGLTRSGVYESKSFYENGGLLVSDPFPPTTAFLQKKIKLRPRGEVAFQSGLKAAIDRLMKRTGLADLEHTLLFESLEDRFIEDNQIQQLHCEFGLKGLFDHDASQAVAEVNLSSIHGNIGYVGWFNNPGLSFTLAFIDPLENILIEGVLIPDSISRNQSEVKLLINAIPIDSQQFLETALRRVIQENTDRALQFAAEKQRHLIDNDRFKYRRAVKRMTLLNPQYIVESYLQVAKIIEDEPFADVLLGAIESQVGSNPAMSAYWDLANNALNLIIEFTQGHDTYRYDLMTGEVQYISQAKNPNKPIPPAVWRLTRQVAAYSCLSGIHIGSIKRGEHRDWRKDVAAFGPQVESTLFSRNITG